MPSGLLSVLNDLHRYGASTAPAIHRRLRARVGASAINNRLENLRREGYVERAREGRCWIYDVVPPGAP